MAFFCYTSGTTGPPKGAVHLHRWPIGYDPNAKYWHAYREDDIVAHTGDLSWIFPLGNGFLYPWRHGVSTLVYHGRFKPERWFALLEKYEVTNFASVPTAYRMLLTVRDAEKKYDLSALRHCISAGEPLNPEVIEAWKRRFGHTIYDGIGMTEIMVYLSNLVGMEVRAGSCGKPQPGRRCAIVDEDGNPQPPGKAGTLAVSKDDPGLFKEYWNKPEKTAECFKKGWFLTGDSLVMDEDGYYWFLGRGDDLIKASGYRISPFEVESALIRHPSVLEAAAVAAPHDVRGCIVKAFIVLKEGYQASEKLAKDIQEFVKQIAAPYKYPRAIEFVEELPKTQSGKIKRKLLREREFEAYQRAKAAR
jgi:acyl-coenzyme A synthetase/AMP-(fatty) acid ligase